MSILTGPFRPPSARLSPWDAVLLAVAIVGVLWAIRAW